MRIPSPYPRKRVRIEIIPLIDIIFFLLATFMIVSLSMVKNLGIQVHLPAAEAGTPEERKTAVTISIAEDGSLYLNKERVRLDELKDGLEVLKEADPQLTVFINGDERAAFGRAVAVFGEVRQLGLDKVSVQVKNKEL